VQGVGQTPPKQGILGLYALGVNTWYVAYGHPTIMVTDRIMEKNKTFNLDRRRLRPIFP
jgi:hypothetical protein